MQEIYTTVSDTATSHKQTMMNESITKVNDTSVANDYQNFELNVDVVIPTIFSVIFAVGFLGNLFVILIVILKQHMRSTMNLLIFNLALADICFIVFCVPFTGAGYVLPKWPFGEVWCKIVQYLIYVCAYASVYTLVLMSFYRYLAVVFPLSSISVRRTANTVRILVFVWVIILVGNIPLLFDFKLVEYKYEGEKRSLCMLRHLLDNNHFKHKVFFACFFMFGYVLPLSSICVLYGFLLKHLLYVKAPGRIQTTNNINLNKRVTKMVIIVVATFAICWLPIQLVFMVQAFGYYPNDISYIVVQMAANCLAYMNSCVNPIIYAILSDKFRIRLFPKSLFRRSESRTKSCYGET